MERERQSEIQMGRDRLTAMVWEEAGVFVSRCGDTPEQGFAKLREAIERYLENAGVCSMFDGLSGPLLTQARYTTTIGVETT